MASGPSAVGTGEPASLAGAGGDDSSSVGESAGDSGAGELLGVPVVLGPAAGLEALGDGTGVEIGDALGVAADFDGAAAGEDDGALLGDWAATTPAMATKRRARATTWRAIAEGFILFYLFLIL